MPNTSVVQAKRPKNIKNVNIRREQKKNKNLKPENSDSNDEKRCRLWKSMFLPYTFKSQLL